ncbi:protein of unknown function [Candidatus Methylopumilus turicensis]|uniref:Uncharacterized protein n=1 Tax=Candidatus Methylopumilus turicensis TaxID=1581680 RepID=A0A0B7J141_9PROT|nr:protein of unknown function [Candidatus Methylopumilus turicensis]
MINIIQPALASIYAFRVVLKLPASNRSENLEEYPEFIAFVSKARSSGWSVNKCVKNLTIQLQEIDRYSRNNGKDITTGRKQILKACLDNWDSFASF